MAASTTGFSPLELERTMTLLAAEIGFERLKDRFVRAGAFTSKRGLGSVKALADRVYALSGGLRREAPASYAFHAVWSEAFQSRLREDDEEALTSAADRINACLLDGKTIDPGKLAVLDEALGEYYRTAAKGMGDEVARFDMLMKAVPSVADRIRAWPGDTPPTAGGESVPDSTDEESE